MSRRLTLACALLFAVPSTAAAQLHVWLIGGGPTPRASEAQIEFNVNWVRESVSTLRPDAVIHAYYGPGAHSEVGTVEILETPSDAMAAFEPLARVFGAQMENRRRYRPHNVEPIRGGTSAQGLKQALLRDFATLEPDDHALLVYNGHGGWNPDHSRNSLRLWEESALTVQDLRAVLDSVPVEVPIQMVFTQCYSGAFERAIRPEAQAVLDLAPGQSCGFFAESEDHLSEGCSASISREDYRDYTTYFFAALTGENRLGDPVEGVMDWDEDGSISPFDAHIYAMVDGRNSDVPRSTSEIFLERWQPWYLRWIGTTDERHNNLYGVAAAQIGARVGIEGPGSGRALVRRMLAISQAIATNEEEIALSTRSTESAQRAIRQRLELRWPTLFEPYTEAHYRLLDEARPALIDAILTSPEFSQLVEAQDRIEQLESRHVELERGLSELERLQRTRRLARLVAQLERHGSQDHVDQYRHLRACESRPLHP